MLTRHMSVLWVHLLDGCLRYNSTVCTCLLSASSPLQFHWIENAKYFGRIGGFSASLDSSTPVNVLAPSSFLTGLNALIDRTDAT